MNFNDNCTEHRFLVYMHVSPAGKRYVGITSQSVTARWGLTGNGYRDNKHFYAAIQKYGWDSFEHHVVAVNLTIQDASALESKLIAQYDTMNPDKGYNNTTGGNWSTPSASVREVLKQRTQERWNDDNYRARMCEIQKKLPHSPLSELHKLHISQATRGRPSPLRGRKLSEAHKLHLKGRTPWNKGLSSNTSDSIQRIKNKLQGRVVSDDIRIKMRQARQQLFMHGYKPMWANNGEVEIQLDVSSSKELPEGFQWGRLPSVYVTDGSQTKKIHPATLNDYISQGWCRGKSEQIQQNVKKSHQKFIWAFEGIEFDSATSLADHLRNHGYPKIVGSTITDLYLKGFEHSKVYASLAGKIQRREVR